MLFDCSYLIVNETLNIKYVKYDCNNGMFLEFDSCHFDI